jgi:hypothetical protein
VNAVSTTRKDWERCSRLQPTVKFHDQYLAGAPGFEPGDGGTKNRCLTAWLRPTGKKWRRCAAKSTPD